MSGEFPYEAFEKHLRDGGAPFGGKFNATINEVVEGYQQVIDDLKREIREAGTDGG